MSVKELQGKTVIVTGAGSGIGQQTAFAFAARGAALELLDVDREGLAITARLARAQGARVATHVVDVSDAAAMDALAKTIAAPSVVVNNAGIGAAGRFVDASLETWRRTIDVNLLGVVHGCRAFLPGMIARGAGGHIVNVASAAGLSAPRDMSVYAATKFAVVGLSQSLRGELAEHRIVVTCVCPGVVDTAIVARTRYEGVAFSSSTQQAVQKFYRRRAYSPSKVASAIVRAIEGGGGILPVTPESWAMWMVERAAPGLLSRLGDAKRVVSR